MNKSTLFAVALPLAVLLAWETRLEWLIRSGTEVRLAVNGFDPRDLLAGHYLTYAVDFGPENLCPQSFSGTDEGQETCVCLSENATTGVYQATWSGACDESPAQCGPFVKGTCLYGMFASDINRFYFPESFQSSLAIVPEKSTIRVVLTSEGRGIVTGFAVDGVDVLEYAKSHTTVP